MPEARLEEPPSPAHAPYSTGLKSRIAARLLRRHKSQAHDQGPEHPKPEPAGQVLRWPADRPHPVLIAVEKKGLLDRLTGLTRFARRDRRLKDSPAPPEPRADFTTFRREPGGAVTLVWPPRPVTAPEQADAGESPIELRSPGSAPVEAEAEAVQPAAEKPAPAERTVRKRRVRRSAPEPAGHAQIAGPPATPDTSELPASNTVEGAAVANPEPAVRIPDGDEVEETVAGSAALRPDPGMTADAQEQSEEATRVETADRAATYDPIPERIGEPLRGMLAREQQVLHQLERAFGPDDPGVLNSRSNLAYYLVSAGEYARAVLVQEQVASETARVLGDKHPHTLTARTRLVQWRKLAKKHRRSRASVSA